MNALPIGITALAAGQRGLALVGQNVANASTPGYHRQGLNLVSLTADGKSGSGVDVASLTRYTAAPVRTAILSSNSDQAYSTARLEVRRQIEVTVGTGTGGTADQLESFFNQVEQLTATPGDSAVIRPTLAAASNLATSLNTAAGDLDRLRVNVGTQIKQTVTEINDYAKQIADLNAKILNAQSQGAQPNEMLDRRDQLIDELSQRIEVKTVDQPGGGTTVVASKALVVGQFSMPFQVSTDPSGNLAVTQQGSTTPITFTSGKLAGLLQEFNQDIPATRGRLDGMANALIGAVNQVHATGLGTAGPQTSATSTVTVADPAAALATQNLPFPIQAGTLTVSVTNAAGARSNVPVAIDPSTDSLNNFAAALNTALTAASGGNVTATVDPASGVLKFDATGGYKFDFAGRDTNPAGGGAVPNSDTANVLSGLGVNGLFTGTGAASIAVRPEVLANPRLFAASRTGQPGDGTNLERIAAVRDQALVSGRTLAADYTDITASVGSDVQTLSDRQTAQTGVWQNLTAQEQATTGVDVNEEMVHLLDYQRMIQGASKYMTVVNDALDAVMNIIR